MSEIAIGKGPLGSAVLTVLTHLKNGEIGDAVDCFAEEFRFKDHGIGLEFKDKERLADVTLHSNHGFCSEPSAYCTQIADFEACLYSNRGRSAGDWSLNQSLRELFERAAVRRRCSGDGHARLARARLRRPSGSRGIRSDFHNVNPLR